MLYKSVLMAIGIFSAFASIVETDCFGHDRHNCQYPHLDQTSVGPVQSISLLLPHTPKYPQSPSFPTHSRNSLTESLELHLLCQFGIAKPGRPFFQAKQIADVILELLIPKNDVQCILAQEFVKDLGVDIVPYLLCLRYFWAEEFDQMGAAEVVPESRLNPPVHQFKRFHCVCFLAFITVEQDLALGEVEAVADDQLRAVFVALVIFDTIVPDNAAPDGLLGPLLVLLFVQHLNYECQKSAN